MSRRKKLFPRMLLVVCPKNPLMAIKVQGFIIVATALKLML